MAGNSVFTGQDGNIYVDFDVQNLIVVDPNKLVDKDGKSKREQLTKKTWSCMLILKLSYYQEQNLR